MDEKVKVHINRAWRCILKSEYMNKCQITSSTHGGGISLFKFCGKECVYHYVEENSTLWDILMNVMPTYQNSILGKYKPNDMYLICVGIPLALGSDEYVYDMNMLVRGTNEKINLLDD